VVPLATGATRAVTPLCAALALDSHGNRSLETDCETAHRSSESNPASICRSLAAFVILLFINLCAGTIADAEARFDSFGLLTEPCITVENFHLVSRKK